MMCSILIAFNVLSKVIVVSRSEGLPRYHSFALTPAADGSSTPPSKRARISRILSATYALNRCVDVVVHDTLLSIPNLMSLGPARSKRRDGQGSDNTDEKGRMKDRVTYS